MQSRQPDRAIEYDERFFDQLNINSAQSASTIVPLLLEMVKPQSVIDVGCGEGAWLKTFSDRGVLDFLGIDGDYVSRDRLKIATHRFRAIDLQHSFDLDRNFDLAICLEVAEHLTADAASGLVESLAKTAPVVCFSAAIPGQGGTDHRNEQWPAYWADLFAAHNYQCYDVLRPRLWNSTEVSFWYAQNMLLYLRADAQQNYPQITAHGPCRPDAMVHPALWTHAHQQHVALQYHVAHPGLKVSGSAVLNAAKQWIGKRIASAPVATNS